jgi:hypothetical protein
MARQLPDWLKVFENPDLNKKVTSGIVSFTRPPYFSIEGDEFTAFDDNGEGLAYGKAIECVVVDANYGISHIYYGRRYQPGQPAAAPLCFSDNGRSDHDPEQRPSASASQPQSEFCQGCKHNAFGTDVLGTGRGKACKEYKKLAVMFDGHIYLLGVPPNSLKNWEQYVEHITNANVTISHVRTKIYFAEQPRGTLIFEALGYAGDPFTVGPNGADVGPLAGFTVVEPLKKLFQDMNRLPDMLDRFTGNNDVARRTPLPAPEEVPLSQQADPRFAQAQASQPAIAPAHQAPAPQPAPTPAAAKPRSKPRIVRSATPAAQPVATPSFVGNGQPVAAPGGAIIEPQVTNDPKTVAGVQKAMKGFLDS